MDARQPDSHEPHSANSAAPFKEALVDAERLLRYAAEIGIEIDTETRSAIIHARAVPPEQWTEDITSALLAALTRLAARLRPVTAESLKAFHDDTRPTVRTYLRIAIILAFVIVPVSIASFVTTALTNTLTKDITRGDQLAVHLRAQLGAAPPQGAPGSPGPQMPAGVNEAEVIAELQEYASTVRVIYARARELHWIVVPLEKVPFEEDSGNLQKRRARFELEPGIRDIYKERDSRTQVYQDVRHFAQSLIDDVSVFYGAITVCILPVLYALLGTCAYLLRTFEDQMTTRTFIPSEANSARFLIAAIGGAVVGLFNNFTISQGASIPPLALAFLIGYAVDVFFAFLEGLLKAFAKNTSPAPTAPALPPPPVASQSRNNI